MSTLYLSALPFSARDARFELPKAQVPEGTCGVLEVHDMKLRLKGNWPNVVLHQADII